MDADIDQFPRVESPFIHDDIFNGGILDPLGTVYLKIYFLNFDVFIFIIHQKIADGQ